jgi:hypothetical protein
MREETVDYYLFKDEGEQFIFEGYNHFMGVFLIVPVLKGVGLATDYTLLCLSGAVIISTALFFKYRTIIDFEKFIIYDEWLFMNRPVWSSKPVNIPEDLQLAIEEDMEPESAERYELTVFDSVEGKYVHVLAFSKIEFAQTWEEVILVETRKRRQLKTT